MEQEDNKYRLMILALLIAIVILLILITFFLKVKSQKSEAINGMTLNEELSSCLEGKLAGETCSIIYKSNGIEELCNKTKSPDICYYTLAKSKERNELCNSIQSPDNKTKCISEARPFGPINNV